MSESEKNDLHPPGPVVTIKYVDDTSVLHVSCDDSDDTLQNAAEYLSGWAERNNMIFNVKKTKEIVFQNGRKSTNLQQIYIGDSVIERVHEAKVLGVVIQANLKWNSHISNIVKKANKRLFLLRLCKRAGVKTCDLIEIYTSLVRSLLEYCCVVWHPALPNYLHDDLERVQKRALVIIFPGVDYQTSMQMAKVNTLYDRREMLCRKLFKSVLMPNHKLHNCLPDVPQHDYNLRRQTIPHVMSRTTKFAKTFIPFCLKKFR